MYEDEYEEDDDDEYGYAEDDDENGYGDQDRGFDVVEPAPNLVERLEALKRRRAAVAEEVEALEAKLGLCEEKLTVLDVTVKIWQRRLRTALGKQQEWPQNENGLVITCRNRLDDLARQQKRGEDVADQIEDQLDDTADLVSWLLRVAHSAQL